jgi:hypothetical protein
MKSQNIVATSDDVNYTITQLGKEFFQWMVVEGRPEEQAFLTGSIFGDHNTHWHSRETMRRCGVLLRTFGARRPEHGTRREFPPCTPCNSAAKVPLVTVYFMRFDHGVRFVEVQAEA